MNTLIKIAADLTDSEACNLLNRQGYRATKKGGIKRPRGGRIPDGLAYSGDEAPPSWQKYQDLGLATYAHDGDVWSLCWTGLGEALGDLIFRAEQQAPSWSANLDTNSPAP